MAKVATEPKTQENWQIQDVKTWPGAFGIYKYSKQAIRLNILPIILLTVMSMAASGLSYGFDVIPRVGPFMGDIASLVVSTFISVALVVVLLDSVRGKKSDPVEALKVSPKYFVKYLLASILVGAIILGSLLAFVIPFFFIAPKLINVFYYLIDKDMGVIESLQASWDSTDSDVGKAYGIAGVYLLIALLFFTILGTLFAIWFGIMYYASGVVYYEYTSRAKSGVKVAPKNKKQKS